MNKTSLDDSMESLYPPWVADFDPPYSVVWILCLINAKPNFQTYRDRQDMHMWVLGILFVH